MEALVLDILLGFSVGLLLGLLGGGGSIITVPALVYLVGQSPHAAVSASLAVVGTNSLLGANFHRLQGTLNWRVSLLFGGTGMLTSYISAGISKQISPTVLLVIFAVLMAVVGGIMLIRRSKEMISRGLCSWQMTMATGAVVGILTGILGVGGGFLIVPALVMLVGLPMQQAVGTSLVIIAMNSFAGLLGHLTSASFDFVLISILVIAGGLGTYIGTRLAKQIPAGKLQQTFGLFVIGLSLLLLYDNLPRLLR